MRRRISAVQTLLAFSRCWWIERNVPIAMEKRCVFRYWSRFCRFFAREEKHVATSRLKFWGWGYEGDVLAPAEVRWLENTWAQLYQIDQFEVTPPPTVEEIQLRPSRLTPPAPLSAI